MCFYIILERKRVERMLKYEIKKVFSRTGGRIALLVLVFLTGITCYFATGISYINENGETESSYGAAMKLRRMQKEWAGYLDEEKIRRVIAENLRISSTPEARSDNVRERNIAYGWGQGIMGIRELLNRSYATGFQEYDYYLADSLSEDDAADFYGNRVKLLKEWLLEEGTAELFSDEEKEFLIQRYEEIKTPFYYDYMKGWTQWFEYAPTIVMIGMMVLGYLVAGIFSNEFAWKADSVFFSSEYGRNKAVRAKVWAGFLIVTGIYWAMMLVYSAFTLIYLGTDGWNCPIQADYSNGWKCFYNVTNLQEYLIMAVGGYVGCLFISFLCMLISAKAKSAVLAVMLPFVLIFLPSFLENITSSSVLNKILSLLPDRLLGVGRAMKYFDLFTIGGKVTGAIPVLFALYGVLAALLPPVIYREYRRRQG